MKNNSKLVLGAIALSVIVSGGMAMATFAKEANHENDERREHSEEFKAEHKGQNHSEFKEQMQAAKSALESNDYNAWVEALSDHPKSEEFVTQENFNTLLQAKALRDEGKMEEAKQLLKDSGIKMRGKHMQGQDSNWGKKHGEGKGEMGKSMQEMKAALESNDYNTWAELMEKHGLAQESINQETFNKFLEAHSLHEAGEHEQAKELMQEIGFEKKHSMKHSMKGSMKHSNNGSMNSSNN